MGSHAGKKLLVIQVAALGWDQAQGLDCKHPALQPMDSVFPALTCTVQAGFRTALPPSGHGMIANGLFCRDLRKVTFWEQSSALIAGERIWAGFRRRGGKVGMLFWQQSLGEDVDVVLSPAPIHKHHGGMIQDCYSKPAGLYERLCKHVGRKFNLCHYWGPMASWKSGQWIADATAALLADKELAPDLCMTYLPTLDYDLQRHGPDHPSSAASLRRLAAQLERILEAAGSQGWEAIVFGDYAMHNVCGEAVFPNRALLEAGIMKARNVKGALYPDLHAGGAFAMVDHQVAHVYVKDDDRIGRVKELLAELPGVAEVLDREYQAAARVDHPNSGELLIVAEADRWFAYPWWTARRQAPDYARHVDIHNKPGFDPCELLWGWPPMSVSVNAARVKGSHGRAGDGCEVAWGATFDLPGQPRNLIDLAASVREWLERA